MVNEKITGYAATTAPLDDELFEIVIDPSGTPINRKITRDDLLDGVTIQQWFGAEAMTPAITAGCNAIAQREIAAANININYLAFPDGVDSEAQFSFRFPQNWNAGTVTAIAHWTTELPSASAETWQIEFSGTSHGNDEAIATAFGTVQNLADTFLAVDDLHITAATSAMTIGGSPSAGHLVTFKLQRDVSDTDTMAGAVQLIGIILEYTITKTASTG